MSVYYEEPPTAPHGFAPQRQRPKLWPWLLVGALTIVVITGLVFVATNGDKGTPTRSAATLQDFTVTGTFTLYDYGSIDHGSATCWGTGGYSDIAAGAQVRISNASGKIVAVGELEPSSYQTGECEFSFEVTSVPKGEKYYEIEISHRGALTYSEAEMQEELALQLGQ